MATKKTTPTVEETVASEEVTASEDITTETETSEIDNSAAAEDATEPAQTEDAPTEDSATEDTPTETPAASSEETPEEAQPDLNETLAPAQGATEAAERVEVPGGRNYETMFIVRVGEDPNAATQRVRALIEQDGGAIDNVRVSGLRRLSYPIKKEIEGIDVVLNGRFTKETAAELDRALKLDEAVLRHMTLREDQ